MDLITLIIIFFYNNNEWQAKEMTNKLKVTYYTNERIIFGTCGADETLNYYLPFK